MIKLKKIITAINNPKLNEELKKEKNFKVIGKDIQYREAILEILEKNKNINIIILSENIPGEIKLENLIKKIKNINEEIKIIFILEKENNYLEKILIKNNILDIYYNNKINLQELIKIINKKETNMEEEIIKLKKIIAEQERYKKNNFKNVINLKNRNLDIIENKTRNLLHIHKKMVKTGKTQKNMSTKIVTFSGNYKSGKSTLALILSQCLSEKNYKVLLIDGDIEKQDLSIVLKKYNHHNYYSKKSSKNIKSKNLKNKYYSTFNSISLKSKNKINKAKTYKYQVKNALRLFLFKINRNLYFFNGLNYLLENKNEKRISQITNTFLEKIETNFNFILIDLSKNNSDVLNKTFLQKSNINLLLMEANLLGIKEIQRLIKKYLYQWRMSKNSLHIIANKQHIASMDRDLISKFFLSKNKIYIIKENHFYSIFLNEFFKKKFLLKNKKIKKKLNKIIYDIFIK